MSNSETKFNTQTGTTRVYTYPDKDGTFAMLDDINLMLPSQTGNSGKFLTTNGASSSWGTPAGSGDVIKVGTPVNNQIGIWTGDGTATVATGSYILLERVGSTSVVSVGQWS